MSAEEQALAAQQSAALSAYQRGLGAGRKAFEAVLLEQEGRHAGELEELQVELKELRAVVDGLS